MDLPECVEVVLECTFSTMFAHGSSVNKPSSDSERPCVARRIASNSALRGRTDLGLRCSVDYRCRLRTPLHHHLEGDDGRQSLRHLLSPRLEHLLQLFSRRLFLSRRQPQVLLAVVLNVACMLFKLSLTTSEHPPHVCKLSKQDSERISRLFLRSFHFDLCRLHLSFPARFRLVSSQHAASTLVQGEETRAKLRVSQFQRQDHVFREPLGYDRRLIRTEPEAVSQ
mmetsp:Transcript_16462/g.33797  ORF Transcript_16462/g.33797 Transcript_16462/m.33797 type:complete len:225 (-) Transcript_16462:163-837(-)